MIEYIRRIMARPIELGLILEYDDALAFHRYIKNTTDTPKGRQLLAEAYEESRHFSLIGMRE